MSTMLNGLVQLLLVVVMARLISPRDFGIITSALLILKAMQVFIQSGYERAVVWAETLSDECLAGLFWASTTTGAFITLIVCCTAAYVSNFFSDQNLKLVLISVSPVTILSAPGLISVGLLRRQMRFRQLSLYDLLSYMVPFLFLGLPLAIAGAGLWALVAANLLQSAMQGAIAFYLARPPILTKFKWADVREPLKFGFSVSGLGIIEFIDRQATQFYTGRWLGMASLGLYNRSFALIQLPLEQMGTAITRVLFSHFNKHRKDSLRLRSVAIAPLRSLSILVIPIASGSAAISETVTTALLGQAWSSAAPIFASLCIGSAAAVLGNLLATMNEAMGSIRAKAILQTGITGVLISLLAIFGSYGPSAVAMCFSGTRILFLAAQVWIAAPHLNISRTNLTLTFRSGIALAIAVSLMMYSTDILLRQQDVGGLIRLILGSISGGVLMGCGVWTLIPETRLVVKRILNWGDKH